MPGKKNGTVVQCDFDGTVTYIDVGIRMLEVFAEGDWRRILEQYHSGEIPVGRFNTDAFALVKKDKETLLKLVRKEARVRDGFLELVEYCRRRSFRLAIVSNGLDFYIREVMSGIGLVDVEVHAARTLFTDDGIDTYYEGPDGQMMTEGFKESYAKLFLNGGSNRLIYIGNGFSDYPAAKLADYAFATGPLIEHCKKEKMDCIPFESMKEIIVRLECLD